MKGFAGMNIGSVSAGRNRRYRLPSRMIAVISCLAAVLMTAGSSSADDIRVITNVESRDVYVGESFLMQISVDGTDEAVLPDFSPLEGFTVEYVGGSNNSSQSISIINGKVQRTVKKGYVFTYRLTPKVSGRLTIPPLDVNVAGTVFKTDRVDISVKKPEETEDFKLRIRLSRDTCYTGEPVVLSVTWYLNRDVESFEFTAPVLDNEAFDFDIPEVRIDPSKKYFRVPVAGSELIAEKGKGILDGKQYVTLDFSIALIPTEPGTFVIPEFIVACESGSGIRTRRDFFDDFFSDSYSGRWKGSLKKYVVPSNRLSLQVKELPEEGMPEGFSGQVGEIRIEAKADPVEVSVGDPITLMISLQGPDFLGRVELPPLSSQKGILEDFKIPDERADGKIEGRKKVFTQTLRARHDGVTGIPPIRIVYFDTKKEKYMIAESDPIPLDVKETRVVTASDAEGAESGFSGSPLEQWKEGIAYNYEGSGLAISEEAGIESISGDSKMVMIVLFPPAGFLLALLGRFLARRRASDPRRIRSKGALKRLHRSLAGIAREKDLSGGIFNAKIMDSFKSYLGDKLHVSGAALTADEAGRILNENGVDIEVIGLVTKSMEACERGAYAGGSETTGREELLDMIKRSAAGLDRVL